MIEMKGATDLLDLRPVLRQLVFIGRHFAA